MGDQPDQRPPELHDLTSLGTISAAKSDRPQDFPEQAGVLKPGTSSIKDDLDKHFSRLQGQIGAILLILLAATILSVALLYATKGWTGLDASDIRDYGALTVGPLITLVASVVGFYFGERRRG